MSALDVHRGLRWKRSAPERAWVGCCAQGHPHGRIIVEKSDPARPWLWGVSGQDGVGRKHGLAATLDDAMGQADEAFAALAST